MKFTMRPNPSQFQTQKTAHIMRDLTIGLLVVFGFALTFYYKHPAYGGAFVSHILIMMVISVGISVGTEALWALAQKKPVLTYLQNSFPWVTGIIITLIMPANLSYYGLAVASLLAIVLGKLVFGGFGHNIFNPAGVARGVVFTSFATATVADLVIGATPVSTFNSLGWLVSDNAALPKLFADFGGVLNVLIGWHAGSIGETGALIILLVGAVLAWRKVLDWRVPVVYLATIFVLTGLVGTMHGLGILYPLYHVLTGGAIFGAVFMLTDPVTNPTSVSGRIIFALGAGILTVLLRLMSNMPEGVVFSILLMNSLTPVIESATDGQQIKSYKKYKILIGSLAIVGITISFLAGSSLVKPEVTPEPEVPTVQLNDEKLKFNDPILDNYEGEVFAKTDDGNVRTYHIKVNGYGLVDNDGSHGGTYSQNEYEIKVDLAEKKVISIVYLHFGDTPGFGDRTVNEAYYELFEGISTLDYEQEINTATKATRTSRSMIKAVKIVMDDLGK